MDIDAIRNWEKMSSDERTRLEYEARLKEVLDEYSFHREAELRTQKAMEEGREEGLKKGLAQGEKSKAKAIALNLLASGMDLESIAKYTELSIKEIQQLQEVSRGSKLLSLSFC
ncbi:hypothetical protein LC040_15660 [Bacillus tianshenii]|nr:hypothetical protein LC040_15660 [Bacillus tianshenii]